MEKIFSFAWKGKRGLDLETPEGENKENGENGDESKDKDKEKDEKTKAHVRIKFKVMKFYRHFLCH